MTTNQHFQKAPVHKQVQWTQSWYDPALKSLNGILDVRRAMQNGALLIQVREKSRTRYKLNNEFITPRIVYQLAKRGLVNLGAA